MTKPIPLEEPKEVYSGKIVGVRRQLMKEPTRTLEYEWAYRSPGTRALIVKDNKILMIHEYRPAQKGYDYRIPGGKVFETLDEYEEALEKGQEYIEQAAEKRIITECLEEAGIVAKKVKHIHTSTCGATMRWDLFCFRIEEFEEHPKGQHLDHGEIIEPTWKTFDEVEQMCLNKQIKEDRTVALLLRFIAQND